MSSSKEYQKEWRAKNRDKFRVYGRAYYAKNRNKIKEKHRLWHEKNKDLVAQRKAKWRSENLELAKSKGAEYRMRQKKLVIAHYSKGKNCCACCDEKETKFLTVDHINGGGNKHRKVVKAGGGDFIRWLINNNFPKGYQILCFNCNCSKGFYGKCPHVK